MSASALPRKSRSSEIRVKIGLYAQKREKHPKYYRPQLEEQLTDFNNF